mgnify:CR=1 FL=1
MQLRHIPKSRRLKVGTFFRASGCLLILSLMLSACNESEANSSDPMTVSSGSASSTSPIELAANTTNWQITAWEQDGVALTSLPPVEISIDLEAQKISGFSGCNNFGGSFTLVDDEVTVRQLRSTQRGCEQAVMEQEVKFLEAIAAVNHIKAEENQLILSYSLDQADGQTGNNLYFSRM